MSDKLENFIRDNRSRFDHREPSDALWNRIDSSLFGRQKSLWGSVSLWRAAAIFFFALSLYLVGARFLQSAPQNTIAMKEFTDIEQFYFEQISQKTQMIEEFRKADGLNGFTHDFQQLEAMYLVLKEEMKNRPSQKVKDALVLNLLVRIDLLNQQLHKLEEGFYDEGQEQKQQVDDKKSADKSV